MRSPTSLRVVLAAAALLAACGDGRGEDNAARADSAKDETPIAGRDCQRAEGDSAQAVCKALNEVERNDRARAQAYAIERYGDTICVRIGPGDDRRPAVLDGESAVAVLHGRVVATIRGDSVPCPHG